MLTDVGRQRRHNEDFVISFTPFDFEVLQTSGCLYFVVDGIGGEAADEVASEYTIRKVQYSCHRSSAEDLGDRPARAIRDAIEDIYRYGLENTDIGWMGTTVVVAVVRGDEFDIRSILHDPVRHSVDVLIQ